MYLPLYYHVGVFILQVRQLKHKLFSSQQVFYIDVQVKSNNHPHQVQTERRVMSMVLDFLVSLFDTSCGLIVERKYIRCTALVELYTM